MKSVPLAELAEINPAGPRSGDPVLTKRKHSARTAGGGGQAASLAALSFQL
jgi:hypothetical protein